MVDNGLTPEAQNYQVIKIYLLKKFAAHNLEAEVMRDAICLKCDGSDIQTFLVKAERAHNQSKHNE